MKLTIMCLVRDQVLSKVLIFGNSGSGKSTLAKRMCIENNSAHLDLDTIAWQASFPPLRTPILESKNKIDKILTEHESWIVEGCYSDLLVLLLDTADKIIFLNLTVEKCILNARNRPWEPHKYESLEAQNSNLEMLIDWISQYPENKGTLSQQTHIKLFDSFCGDKEMRTTNM